MVDKAIYLSGEHFSWEIQRLKFAVGILFSFVCLGLFFCFFVVVLIFTKRAILG